MVYFYLGLNSFYYKYDKYSSTDTDYNIILLLLDLVVFRGLFREELFAQFSLQDLSALDELSVQFAMDVQ